MPPPCNEPRAPPSVERIRKQKREAVVAEKRKRAVQTDMGIEEPQAKRPRAGDLEPLKELFMSAIAKQVVAAFNQKLVNQILKLDPLATWDDVPFLAKSSKGAVKWQQVQELVSEHRKLQRWPKEKTPLPQGGFAPNEQLRPDLCVYVCGGDIAHWIDELPAPKPEYNAKWTYRDANKPVVSLRHKLDDMAGEIRRDVVQTLQMAAMAKRVGSCEDQQGEFRDALQTVDGKFTKIVQCFFAVLSPEQQASFMTLMGSGGDAANPQQSR